MVTYGPEELGLADKSPCAEIRADLKMCLLESNCCKKEKKTPKECLKHNLVPDECHQLRQIFFECKRSLGALSESQPWYFLTQACLSIQGDTGHYTMNASTTLKWGSFGELPVLNLDVTTTEKVLIFSGEMASVLLDNRRRFRGHKGY